MTAATTSSAGRLAAARAAIARAAPQLADAPLRVLPSLSAAIVVEVGGTHVFRFARDPTVVERHARERRTLDGLAGRLSTSIPVPEYHSEKPPFIGYRKLDGAMPTPECVAALGADGRERLYRGVARFLTEMHGNRLESFNHVGRFRYSAARGEQWLKANRARFRGLDPTGRVEAYVEETTAAAGRLLAPSVAPVLCHADLHARNLLCDPHSGELTGVLDFADAMIGDHHFDFRKLRRLGDDATARIARQYEAVTGRRVDLDRVRVLERVWICQSIGRPRPDSQRDDWALGVARGQPPSR